MNRLAGEAFSMRSIKFRIGAPPGGTMPLKVLGAARGARPPRGHLDAPASGIGNSAAELSVCRAAVCGYPSRVSSSVLASGTCPRRVANFVRP